MLIKNIHKKLVESALQDSLRSVQIVVIFWFSLEFYPFEHKYRKILRKTANRCLFKTLQYERKKMVFILIKLQI